jgi:hypothetical protein
LYLAYQPWSANWKNPIVTNLKSLLGLDLDGDGEPDDLDRAISAINSAPAEVVTPSEDGEA